MLTITFTFPNSEYSFTLENGKSLSDYDESMQDYPSNIGIGMIELALGSMQTNKELDIIASQGTKVYLFDAEDIFKMEKYKNIIYVNTTEIANTINNLLIYINNEGQKYDALEDKTTSLSFKVVTKETVTLSALLGS